MLKVGRMTIAAYVLPTFIVVALINLYPIFYTFNLAFTNKNTFNEVDNSYHYIGLNNFQYVIQQTGGDFLRVLLSTTLYVVACVALYATLGLVTAMALNHPKVRGKGFWGNALILPWTVPTVVTALIWKFFYNYNFGPINQIIRLITHNPGAGILWLDQPVPAFIAVVIVNIWMSYPFFMVVSLGALQSIPHELLEAAQVDGAAAWQRFRYVMLPLLRPALLPATILSAITTFQMFNTVYLITLGGPFTSGNINNPGATELLLVYMYDRVENGGNFFVNYGHVAAIAILVFIVLLALTIASLRFTNLAGEAR
jgi:arabinogalactan oligomer / maltooligosaccharide transport system permease protein